MTRKNTLIIAVTAVLTSTPAFADQTLEPGRYVIEVQGDLSAEKAQEIEEQLSTLGAIGEKVADPTSETIAFEVLRHTFVHSDDVLRTIQTVAPDTRLTKPTAQPSQQSMS
jgi:hypothetical protein